MECYHFSWMKQHVDLTRQTVIYYNQFKLIIVCIVWQEESSIITEIENITSSIDKA